MEKTTQDLGVGAYLLMHGFKVVRRDGRDIVFEVSEEDEDDFKKQQFAYLSSDFHRFDACLMALKKM